MRRFIVVLALMLALAPFASSSPDGLEKVAIDKGFAEQARPPQSAPVPDYAFPGVADPRLATALAALAGVLVLGAVAVVVRRPRAA